MRQPYGEAFLWIFQLGPAYTGRGSAGTNTAQFSIRTAGDAPYSTFDWATGVLELSGGGGSYVALIPADAFPAADRYILRGRPASSLAAAATEEELIIFAPVATQASVDTVAGYVDTEVASLITAVAAVNTLATAINAKTTNLPGDPADESDILAATTALATAIAAVNTLATAIKASTDNLPSDPADESLVIDATSSLASAISALGTPSQASALVTAQGDLTTLVGRLTLARAAKLDHLDADMTTRATPADVDVQVEADLADLEAAVAAIKVKTDKIREIT